LPQLNHLHDLVAGFLNGPIRIDVLRDWEVYITPLQTCDWRRFGSASCPILLQVALGPVQSPNGITGTQIIKVPGYEFIVVSKR
jgi:hypothetical protein